MHIVSTKIAKKETSAPAPERPGLLLGIDHPSPALASAAQRALGTNAPPGQLLLGIPSASIRSNEFDEIVGKLCLTATKLITTELAAAGPRWLQVGVDVFWAGVNVGQVYQKWNDPNRNVPALWIESTAAGLGALGVVSDVTGVGQSFFGNTQLQDQIGLVFTAAGAAAEGEDIGMALVHEKAQSTDAGKVMSLINPIVDAAINTQVHGVQFRPMSSIESTSF